MNKMAKSTYLSTTTLNTNGLNEPIKRHATPKRVQKQDSYICCLQETNFRAKHKRLILELNTHID